MRIADLPLAAVESLKRGCDGYISGFGRVRFADVSQLTARGVIADALVELPRVDSFLAATGNDFDSFFTRMAVFLFDADYPVGTVGLLRTAVDEFVVEHVTVGGAEVIVDGLEAAEALPGSEAIEARLLRVPEIYLVALVLSLPGAPTSFLVLSPPYVGFSAPQTHESFAKFVHDLVKEHEGFFPQV